MQRSLPVHIFTLLALAGIAQGQSEATSIPVEASAPGLVQEGYGVRWKNGLRIQSSDGSVKIKIGGRIMNDWGFFSADNAVESAVGDLENGTEFRRSRLYVSGRLNEFYEFKAQYDFADNPGPEFKDVYMGLIDVEGFPDVRIGHFKEPFGLDELTSSKYGMFMERSLTAEFAPSRNTGILFHGSGADGRSTWAAGVFRDADDFGGNTGNGEYSVTARVTGLPIYEGEGERLLHLGVAVRVAKPSGDMVSFGSRPEMHLAPDFIDTGDIPADGLTVIGLEASHVHGPFSIQAEYALAQVDALTGDDPSFSTYAVQASFFLTGEHRAYDTETAEFDRVSPAQAFSKGGHGAWEVALRLSSMDLNDAGVTGGSMDNLTLGLNWYMEANTRVMLNVVQSDLDGVGDTTGVMLRFQIDF